jgi:hypothetical protein
MIMPTTTATQPTNAPAATTVTLSTRGDAKRVALVDLLRQRWGMHRADALGRLLDALGDEEGGAGLNEEHVAAIEALTFRRHAVLPAAKRYRLVRAWKGMIGINHYDYPRGTILSRDLHGPELLQQLHERDAALQPLAD